MLIINNIFIVCVPCRSSDQIARGTRRDRSAVGDGAAIVDDVEVITNGVGDTVAIADDGAVIIDGKAAVMTRARVRKTAGL